jgi:hypothetical protein
MSPNLPANTDARGRPLAALALRRGRRLRLRLCRSTRSVHAFYSRRAQNPCRVLIGVLK